MTSSRRLSATETLDRHVVPMTSKSRGGPPRDRNHGTGSMARTRGSRGGAEHESRMRGKDKWRASTVYSAKGIILGIFREIPTVHNLPFTPPVPGRAWLLVGPAPIHVHKAFTLELVRNRQPPLPVLGIVAGKSCACSRSELVQDSQAPLPVPGMVAGLVAYVAGESCTYTRMHDLDRQPPLPVLGTIAGKSCICTPIHKHLCWKWFRVGGLHGASVISMNAHSGFEFIRNHEALFWRLSEFASVGLQLQHWLAIEYIPGDLVVHNMGHYILR
ncbi:hypothetical protein B0H13DRAFT_1863407 [Mycena leptocephala]|nr:hypothetical protein B0H13DRAFT_1863407 [Mycena leptocephala]